MDELPATDPDCPACGTRCTPDAIGAWVCRRCEISVLGGEDASPIP